MRSIRTTNNTRRRARTRRCWVMPVYTVNHRKELKAFCEAIRDGRWVRHTPKLTFEPPPELDWQEPAPGEVLATMRKAVRDMVS